MITLFFDQFISYLSGPWRDRAILQQLERRHPSLSPSLVNFDITEGNPESLKALNGIHTLEVAETGSNLEELMRDELGERMENEALHDEEIDELEQQELSRT